MQPQFKDSIKILSLPDLFTVCYVIVSDLYNLFVPEIVKNRPGSKPRLSDAEIITIVIVGELFGMDVEIRWYTLVKQAYLNLFPNLNERSRFNRRRRDLCQVINLLRAKLLEILLDPNDPYRIIDSFPVVIANYGRRSQVKVARNKGGYGICCAKQLRFFGYRLHLLITLEGLIVNFVLAPANESDIRVAPEVLEGMVYLILLGDAIYSSPPLVEAMRKAGILMLVLVNRRWHEALPKEVEKLLKGARCLIETVGSQLSRVLHIEMNWAKSERGIETRIIGKLFAHTIGSFINKLRGTPPLKLASLIY
jgi:Transposase DDE domain